MRDLEVETGGIEVLSERLFHKILLICVMAKDKFLSEIYFYCIQFRILQVSFYIKTMF